MWGHQTNICKFTSLNPSQVPASFSQGASSRFSKNSSQDTPTFIGIIFILFMNKEGWNYIISPFEILIFREWYNWIMLTSLELTNPKKILFLLNTQDYVLPSEEDWQLEDLANLLIVMQIL